MLRKMLVVLALMTFISACDKLPPPPAGPSPTPPPPGGPPSTPPAGWSFFNTEDMTTPAAQLPIWALRGANSVLFVMQSVFGDPSGRGNSGLHPLHRIVSGQITISVPTELTELMSPFQPGQPGALEWKKITGFEPMLTTGPSQFSIKIGDTTSGGFVWPAVCQRSWDANGNITAATVVIRSADVSFVTLLHELGHAFGMDHHMGFGLMGVEYDAAAIAFSQPEIDNAAMMLRLPTNTPAPGSSSTATSSFLEGILSSKSKGVTTEVIQ